MELPLKVQVTIFTTHRTGRVGGLIPLLIIHIYILEVRSLRTLSEVLPMEYTRENKHEVAQLYLHDSEISSINCLYLLKRVEVPLKLGHIHRSALLVFEGVESISISLSEPWGSGHYIHEVSVEHAEESPCDASSRHFVTVILLNSGDKIIVGAERLAYVDKT